MYIKYYTEHGEKRITKEAQLWYGIKKRCLAGGGEQKRRPSYAGCTASENFKDFQYFAEWCNKQIGFNIPGFELDKDLLYKGNKKYSEDTCVFIPYQVNTFLTKRNTLRGDFPIGVSFDARDKIFTSYISDGSGKRKKLGVFKTPDAAFLAYKTAKEQMARLLAEKFSGSVDSRVVSALMNYNVEVTD